MSDSTVTTRLAPAPSVRSMVTADGAVLLDLEQNLCVSLSPVGGFIWERLEAGKTRGEILADLGLEFADVDRQELVRDLDEFVAGLASSRLVTGVII